MGQPIGPKKVHRYSNEFNVQAVRLSLHPEIQTQDVAKALDIHPYMLSRWKKEYREGALRASRELKPPELPPGDEQKALQTLTHKVDALSRKKIATTEGNLGVQVMRHSEGGVVECITISYWASRDDIKNYVGEDIEKPHHLARDAEFLLELPEAVKTCDLKANEWK